MAFDRGASLRHCQNGCGWSAFQSHETCCRSCRGPEGPHSRDCEDKNKLLCQPCSRGCGRPAFGAFGTCCKRCRGLGGQHSSDCDEKCVATAAAAAERASTCGGGALPAGMGVGGEVAIGGGSPRRTFRASGRRRAVLVGINYEGTRAQLRGCINDVKNIENLLTHTFGWRHDCIQKLTSDDRRCPPTRRNIETALRWLVADVVPGDVLFFHFSGHGAEQEDPNGYEENGMDETILPIDFQHAGMITDDRISELVVAPLPEGVRLTAVLDCCHSGTGMDLPFRLSKTQGWREEVNPFHSRGDVQMFSGCDDDGTSADAKTAYGASGGAMTTAFCEILRKNQHPGYVEFMKLIYENLRQRKFTQRPLLTSAQRFDLDRQFDLDDILPNSNAHLGRTVRQRFKPKPRKMHGPLAELLGLGVAVVGGMILQELLKH